MKKETDAWTIGISNTAAGGVFMKRVRGTKDMAREHLFGLVAEDREKDPSGWERGTEKPSDIEEAPGRRMDAWAVYGDCHIDYTAIPEQEAEELEKQPAAETRRIDG